MKIIEEKLKAIAASEMEDGNIGVIIEAPAGEGKAIGAIAQRFESQLILVGITSGLSYPHGCVKGVGFRVRILPPGTKLEI